MNLNDRETATVLAALRFLQQHIEKYSMAPASVYMIATDYGKLDPATPKEIDSLCELLNTDSIDDLPRDTTDVVRDDSYPVITLDGPEPESKLIPLGAVGGDSACVSLAHISDDEVTQDVRYTKSGDLMNDVPSIVFALPESTAGRVLLTWAEAYNMGRALIDVTNVAYYG